MCFLKDKPPHFESKKRHFCPKNLHHIWQHCLSIIALFMYQTELVYLVLSLSKFLSFSQKIRCENKPKITTNLVFSVQSPPRIIKQPPTDELLFQVKSRADENDKPFIIECEADGEPAPV
jgi:hypothetical protein